MDAQGHLAQVAQVNLVLPGHEAQQHAEDNQQDSQRIRSRL
jgi:hypothetical protein